MVDILPNQINEEKQENKENEIIKSGGEKIIDTLVNIQLINQMQYNLLSDDEKKKYVKYNPSLTSQAYIEYINKQNQLVDQLNQLTPLIEKAPTLDNLESINNFLEPIKGIAETTQTILDAISALTSAFSTLGIGQLGDVLLGIFKLIGALSAMLYLMMKNPYNMIKEYQEAFDSIDTEALKTQFSIDTTPNLKLSSAKLNTLYIPDAEIKAYINTNMALLDTQLSTMTEVYTTITSLEELSSMADTIQKTMSTITKATATAAAGIAELAEQQVVNEFNKVYDEHKIDYKAKTEMITKNVNNFMHNFPQKYIKATDLEKLKDINKPIDII